MGSVHPSTAVLSPDWRGNWQAWQIETICLRSPQGLQCFNDNLNRKEIPRQKAEQYFTFLHQCHCYFFARNAAFRHSIHFLRFHNQQKGFMRVCADVFLLLTLTFRKWVMSCAGLFRWRWRPPVWYEPRRIGCSLGFPAIHFHLHTKMKDKCVYSAWWNIWQLSWLPHNTLASWFPLSPERMPLEMQGVHAVYSQFIKRHKAARFGRTNVKEAEDGFSNGKNVDVGFVGQSFRLKLSLLVTCWRRLSSRPACDIKARIWLDVRLFWLFRLPRYVPPTQCRLGGERISGENKLSTEKSSGKQPCVYMLYLFSSGCSWRPWCFFFASVPL